MSGRPTPRTGVYEVYWRFAAERHHILERRAAGEPGPWTDDPILRTYHFCNAFRAADRVSQYLIGRFCGDDGPVVGDTLFRIVAFRLFSRIETWRAVVEFLGGDPTLGDLADGRFTAALDHARRITGKLYTGAFILCAADAFGHGSKHLNHVALLRRMFLEDDLSEAITRCGSLDELYRTLHGYPLIGDFMAYQLAIDLNYSTLLDFDENDFTGAGPGAVRGIRKCFLDTGDLSPEQVIHRMVERQADEFARLGVDFAGLWGRPLHAIDCQNLFCETDKYCRVAVPELASNRTRIKRRFRPATEPLSLFFPPRWGINRHLPAVPVHIAPGRPGVHGAPTHLPGPAAPRAGESYRRPVTVGLPNRGA